MKPGLAAAGKVKKMIPAAPISSSGPASSCRRATRGARIDELETDEPERTKVQ